GSGGAGRGGGGGVFVGCKPCGWLEHWGPLDDQPLGYRPRGEFDAGVGRDPVKLYRERCQERGVAGETEVAAMVTAITAEIDDAVSFAKASPFPARDQLAAHLYAP